MTEASTAFLAVNDSPCSVVIPVAFPLVTKIFSTLVLVRTSPPVSTIMPTIASTTVFPPPTGTGMPPIATAAPITLVINALAASSGPSPLCNAQGARSDRVTGELKERSSQGAAGSRSSAPLAINPRRPSCLYAFQPSFRDRFRHRSVPRSPNANSAFAPKSFMTAFHVSRSPRSAKSAALIAGSVEIIPEPSALITPVGIVVFTY